MPWCYNFLVLLDIFRRGVISKYGVVDRYFAQNPTSGELSSSSFPPSPLCSPTHEIFVRYSNTSHYASHPTYRRRPSASRAGYSGVSKWCFCTLQAGSIFGPTQLRNARNSGSGQPRSGLCSMSKTLQSHR
jgi:hypothetical protein